MAKEKEILTRALLRGKAIKELKSLDLYKKAKLSQNLSKSDIIIGLLKYQKSLTKAPSVKVKSQVKKDIKVVSKTKVENKEVEVAPIKKELKENSKPVFTRSPKVKRINPMTLR